MKPPAPLARDEWDYWKAQHLLNRAGFGGPPARVRGLFNMGLEGAVDYIVDYHGIETEPVMVDRFDPDIMYPLSKQDSKRRQEAFRTGDEETLSQFRRRRQKAQHADRRQMRDIQHWWMTRMIETPRPLEEKMTLFWHGHFATSYRGIQDSYHMFRQNQLFRHHAVGNVKALAHAIIRDPAMLQYLNNDRNNKQKPNENLARELMELFTLGEGHGYTENDIRQGARALTGYTFLDDDFIDLGSRQYRRRHDDGRKTILGKTGNFDGDEFIEIIFTRRACSEFLCWKLYRYFVNDLPTEPDRQRRNFILGLAKSLRDNRYQLRPVLKVLFASAHFFDPSNIGSQIKSPIQLIVQASRSLGTPTRQLSVLTEAADRMGQHIFFPPSVKGWEGGRLWINPSTLFVRQNTLVYMLTGRHPTRTQGKGSGDGAAYDATHLVEHLREPDGSLRVRDAVTYLLRISVAGSVHPQRIDRLVDFVQSRGGRLDNAMLVALLALITAMPEYQLT